MVHAERSKQRQCVRPVTPKSPGQFTLAAYTHCGSRRPLLHGIVLLVDYLVHSAAVSGGLAVLWCLVALRVWLALLCGAELLVIIAREILERT